MKVRIQDNILIVNAEDLPAYKQGGSVVRNSYFWALKSIACYAGRGTDWEFDAPVWVALSRMLSAFTLSGYLRDRETNFEFPVDTPIPETLRNVSTYL